VDKSTLKAWYQASRPPFFVATLIPLAIGGALAGIEGKWNTLLWLVILLASFLVHLCTNLANDLFDHLAGVDDGDSIGGSRVIQQGKISTGQLTAALFILYGLALICGLFLLWKTENWWLVAIMLFSFFSSLFYTAPPIRYGYHGLGELLVGINMGPVMVAGTYWVLTGKLTTDALLLSIPTAVMVAMILFYQSLPDMEIDKKTEKYTIAVRLGKAKALWLFRIFAVLALGSIIALVLAGKLASVASVALFMIYPILRTDRMIRTTENWVELHGKGGKVRIFYLVNGLILIVSIIFFLNLNTESSFQWPRKNQD